MSRPPIKINFSYKCKPIEVDYFRSGYTLTVTGRYKYPKTASGYHISDYSMAIDKMEFEMCPNKEELILSLCSGAEHFIRKHAEGRTNQ